MSSSISFINRKLTKPQIKRILGLNGRIPLSPEIFEKFNDRYSEVSLYVKSDTDLAYIYHMTDVDYDNYWRNLVSDVDYSNYWRNLVSDNNRKDAFTLHRMMIDDYED